MSTNTGRGQGKSKFIRELLRRDSDANPKAINEAWQEAGNEGTISGTWVYKIRSELGLTDNKRPTTAAGAAGAPAEKPRRKAQARGPQSRRAAGPVEEAPPSADGKSTAPQPRGGAALLPSGDQGRKLDELEGDIDTLIFKLKGQGGLSEVEEALRRARRLLVRGHQE